MDSKVTNAYPIVWEPIKVQMLHISLLTPLSIEVGNFCGSCNVHLSWKTIFVSKSCLLFQSDVFGLFLFSLLCTLLVHRLIFPCLIDCYVFVCT